MTTFASTYAVCTEVAEITNHHVGKKSEIVPGQLVEVIWLNQNKNSTYHGIHIYDCITKRSGKTLYQCNMEKLVSLTQNDWSVVSNLREGTIVTLRLSLVCGNINAPDTLSEDQKLHINMKHYNSNQATISFRVDKLIDALVLDSSSSDQIKKTEVDVKKHTDQQDCIILYENQMNVAPNNTIESTIRSKSEVLVAKSSKPNVVRGNRNVFSASNDNESEMLVYCYKDDCGGCWFVNMPNERNMYQCPVCEIYNCLSCQVIHENMSCEQYKQLNPIREKIDIDQPTVSFCVDKLNKTLVFSTSSDQIEKTEADTKKNISRNQKSDLKKLTDQQDGMNLNANQINDAPNNATSERTISSKSEVTKSFNTNVIRGTRNVYLASHDNVHNGEVLIYCNKDDCGGCWFVDMPNERKMYQCPVCEIYNCLSCQVIHENMSCEQYQQLNPIRENIDNFYEECLICCVTINPENGIQLPGCLHIFCRECIIVYIECGNESEIKCPLHSCINILKDWEIKLYSKGREVDVTKG